MSNNPPPFSNIALAERALNFACSQMRIAPNFDLPVVTYGLLGQNSRGSIKGRYHVGRAWIEIDAALQGLPAEGAFLAHEMVHYLQDVLGQEQSEDFAVQTQYAWSDTQ